MKRKQPPETVAPALVKKSRCAVYCRKSSEEGLDMDYTPGGLP